MGELDGRIALVTGAARGIGAATARTLAGLGAKVILSDLEAPVALAEELGGLALTQDVTSEERWIETIAFAREKAGGLDILINNAGLYMLQPIATMSLEDWRRLHAVNVEGVFLGCKHAIPLLAERAPQWKGGASIVNLSSVAGLRGAALSAAYNASKGAVRLFTKGLAMELAAQRIRVNSVHPGIIETDMGRDLIVRYSGALDSGDNEIRSSFTQRHVLGHFGEAANIADAISFLASDRAAFMTGSEVIVDGGFSAH